jgi:hypothetical protein
LTASRLQHQRRARRFFRGDRDEPQVHAERQRHRLKCSSGISGLAEPGSRRETQGHAWDIPAPFARGMQRLLPISSTSCILVVRLEALATARGAWVASDILIGSTLPAPLLALCKALPVLPSPTHHRALPASFTQPTQPANRVASC